jgi:hypothetical protein
MAPGGVNWTAIYDHNFIDDANFNIKAAGDVGRSYTNLINSNNATFSFFGTANQTSGDIINGTGLKIVNGAGGGTGMSHVNVGGSIADGFGNTGLFDGTTSHFQMMAVQVVYSGWVGSATNRCTFNWGTADNVEHGFKNVAQDSNKSIIGGGGDVDEAVAFTEPVCFMYVLWGGNIHLAFQTVTSGVQPPSPAPGNGWTTRGNTPWVGILNGASPTYSVGEWGSNSINFNLITMTPSVTIVLERVTAWQLDVL